jgi:hypothetical protein
MRQTCNQPFPSHLINPCRDHHQRKGKAKDHETVVCGFPGVVATNMEPKSLQRTRVCSSSTGGFSSLSYRVSYRWPRTTDRMLRTGTTCICICIWHAHFVDIRSRAPPNDPVGRETANERLGTHCQRTLLYSCLANKKYGGRLVGDLLTHWHKQKAAPSSLPRFYWTGRWPWERRDWSTSGNNHPSNVLHLKVYEANFVLLY